MSGRPRIPALLLINADDYGYAPGISRGILHCAERGRVAATGILATSPISDGDWQRLREAKDYLDLGVHLSLSHGNALSGPMREALASSDGKFPGKLMMALQIVSGAISLAAVEAELRAQIELCRAHVTELAFLNSHEHLHMLPQLAPIVTQLAESANIPFVRFTRPDPLRGGSSAGRVRDTLIRVCGVLDRSARADRGVQFLGLSESGRISVGYLERLFAQLRPGRAYELMCHPGFFEAGEIADPKLLAYHRWEAELEALCSEELGELLERYAVKLISYRALGRN